MDRNRPLEDIVATAYISKKLKIGSGEHNFTLGLFSSYAKARDDNWLYRYLGDFRDAPEMVTLSYTDTNDETVYYSRDGYINGSGAQTTNIQHALRKNAVYFADEIVWDKFSLDIGARYEKAEGFITRENGIGTNKFLKGTVETSDYAVAIAGLYKLSSSVNLYANGSKGYFFPEIRSVKFSSPGVTQSYEPEKIYQTELGAKFSKGKFAGSLAGYLVYLNDRRSVDFENDGFGGVKEVVRVQSTRPLA